MPEGRGKYRSSFGPLVRLRYGWWLIFFFDAALFAGERRLSQMWSFCGLVPVCFAVAIAVLGL
jgi:hypothetical protein